MKTKRWREDRVEEGQRGNKERRGEKIRKEKGSELGEREGNKDGERKRRREIVSSK